MIVVLEGVNRTGKTTICDLLCSVHGFVVVKPFSIRELNVLARFGYSSEEVRAFVYGSLYTSVKTFGKLSDVNAVFDRFHISEAVHGALDRGCKRDRDMIQIDQMLSAIGAKLVLMDDCIGDLNDRNGRDVSELSFFFDQFFINSAMDKMRYNLSDPVGQLVRWLRNK